MIPAHIGTVTETRQFFPNDFRKRNRLNRNSTATQIHVVELVSSALNGVLKASRLIVIPHGIATAIAIRIIFNDLFMMPALLMLSSQACRNP